MKRMKLNKNEGKYSIAFKALILLAVLSIASLLYISGTAITGPTVPNEAFTVGIVSEYGIISSRLLGIQPEQPIYKLTILLESSEDVAGMPNLLMGKEGQDITFYTKERQSSDLFSKKVKAKASWSGDEHGGRWWVRDVKVFE